MKFVAHVRESDGAEQDLKDHLRRVARRARCFAAKIGMASQGELIGLLHDIGKYSAEFQAYIRSATGKIDTDADDFVDAEGLRGRIDHSTAGAQVIWDQMIQQPKIGPMAGQILALCIASHHSSLIDCVTVDGLNNTFKKRMRKPDDHTHRNEVCAKLDKEVAHRLDALLSDATVLDGIRVALQKIVALHEKGELIVRFNAGLLTRFLFSCLIDADRLDTACFERPKAARQRPEGKYEPWEVLIERLEKHLAGFARKSPIDDIRRDVSDSCRNGAQRAKGIYTLTVPTGGGKTLASLRFALHHAKHHQMDRIVFVVPYTTIIDQNAGKVRDILEPDKRSCGRVVLEHHASLTPERQGWREKMLSENWDTPVVYTTSVQLLDSLFGGGTRGPRRMHQLANAVLVFDEIQTLPIKCVHLFCNAMNFLVEMCGSTVVLCTATQPLLHLVDAGRGAMKYTDGSELMPNVRSLFDDLRRVEVINQRKAGGWTDDEIARLTCEETSKNGSCLVIVNTKKSAQSLYRLCKGQCQSHVFHLSTNMCPVHRKKILADVQHRLDNKIPVLCISTQLIEAGVDVDFGSVIRFTAGMDSIAQAAGRCNRNGKMKTGRVHVINPAAENVDMLRDIQCGKNITERLLDDAVAGLETFGDNLVGPDVMERFFQYYFFARRDEMAYPVSANDIGHDDTLLNILSVNSMAVAEYARSQGEMPDIYLRQSFMAAGSVFKAIDAPTRGIIVPYGRRGQELIGKLCGAFEVKKQIALLREAQQYAVSVFPNVLEKLQKAGAVHSIKEGVDILYLSDSRFYHPEFGLSEAPEGSMEVQIA